MRRLTQQFLPSLRAC